MLLYSFDLWTLTAPPVIIMKSCCINGKLFEWNLISRRSCFRAGVRYYVRGNYALHLPSVVTPPLLEVFPSMCQEMCHPTRLYLVATFWITIIWIIRFRIKSKILCYTIACLEYVSMEMYIHVSITSKCLVSKVNTFFPLVFRETTQPVGCIFSESHATPFVCLICAQASIMKATQQTLWKQSKSSSTTVAKLHLYRWADEASFEHFRWIYTPWALFSILSRSTSISVPSAWSDGHVWRYGLQSEHHWLDLPIT